MNLSVGSRQYAVGKKILLFAYSLFTIHHSLLAQDTLRKEIPEVIVTATRTSENPNNVGRSVTVIQKDEIQKLQSNDLAQLLSMQQGISVTGAGENPGMTETIFMRGTNSNHSLMMIDGVRITDPSTVNDALDLAEIPVSGFEQIEIVRGSHSTLYGSSCIGGVINLISAGKQSPGFHTDVSVRSGTFGAETFSLEENLHLNYSWKSGLYANLDFYNINVQGLDATVDTVTNPNAFKSFDQDNLNLLKGSAKVGFVRRSPDGEHEKWNVFATYGYTDERNDFDKTGWKYNSSFGPNPLAYYDGDSTKIFTTRHLITYNASHQFSKIFSLSLNGGYTSLSRDVIDDSSIVDQMGTSDQTFLHEHHSGSNTNHDLQSTISLEHVKFIAGAGWMRESMTDTISFYSNSFYGAFISGSNLDSLHLHDDLLHAYAQVEIKGSIISKSLAALSLIAGTRYNHHNLFGNAINYEINPSYQLAKDALIYASFSSGFNAPSLYELYSPESYYASGITRGNPRLQPEISHSFEFGFKQQIEDWFQFAIALYQNEVRHEIEYVYLWDKNIGIDTLGNDLYRDDYRGDSYLNVGTLQSRGIEISFSSKLNNRFSLSGNLNIVSGKLSYDPSDVDTSHTAGNHVQLFNNGIFLTQEIESIGLTRRPSTANFFVSYTPTAKASFEIASQWNGPHTDIYYDSNLGPFGALNTVAIEDYVLFDFLASYQFNKKFSVALKAENILDTKFTDLRGFTSRGRGFYLTLHASF
ncbi:MAG TPA: TonB-dependent receptor [Chitinophagales bacterium]|nr:TonB-dependent receptor [Chitinophagales bacterium]